MTTTIIHNARLLDPATGLDTAGGVLIEDGVIADIGKDVGHGTADELINANGRCLAPGLIDLRVKTGEPGAVRVNGPQALDGASRSVHVFPAGVDDPAVVEHRGRKVHQVVRRKPLLL